MTRVGPNKYLEEQCYIEWCDADYLSNDFLEVLFKNMRKVSVEERDNNRYISVWTFSNMKLWLWISWEHKNDICVFKFGTFSISFQSIDCPEPLAWCAGGWPIYTVRWLLDEAATKRIYAIYKKYKECLNL